MGCNCGGRKAGTEKPKPTKQSGSTQTFSLRMDDGRVFSFGSRLEADAARVRQGSGRVVASS